MAMETNNLSEIHILNHIGTITLETKRLTLRRFTADDTEAVYNCSDERYNVVVDAIKNYNNENIIEYLQNLLKGKYGFMCQYE